MKFYSKLVISLLLGMGPIASAADSVAITSNSLADHPAIQNPYWMKNAVEVRISKRGQRLFSDQLMSLLSNLGVVIDENYFPAFEYVSKEPIKIDELAKKQPDEFKMLIDVREFFKGYLQGIEFKDFKPSIQIGESNYKAEFNNLSLVTDESLMRSLGKKDGAVLAIKMSVRNLEGRADGIKAKDLENPWIGEIGVTSPELKIGTADSPLIATMPFYVRVNEQGLLEFEALKLEENIDRVPIEVKYQNIVLPKFEFKVEGQAQTYKISLNETKFKGIVDEHLPDGLKMIRKYLREFLQNDLPRILNEKAQESLKEQLEQIQPVPAPNTQPGDTRPDFSLGLRLNKLNLVDSQWSIGLSAFIEDTSLRKATPAWAKSEARGGPIFNHMLPDNNFDLAIAIDRALFNRAIHLATNRNNFKKLETCPGQPTIELVSGPAIDYNPKVKSTVDLEAPLTMFVDALVDVPKENRKFWGFPVVKDKLHLKMRYQAIIKPAAPGSAKLSIFPTGPDIDSLQIDSDSLRGIGKLFEGRVREEVVKILSGSTSCGSTEPLANFELINSLWGIPLEYAKIRMDSQGQLMLYMNYKKVTPGDLSNGKRR